MPRLRISALLTRQPRILILAIPAAILLLTAIIVVYNAQSSLSKATKTAASAHQIPFTLRALPGANGSLAFEPVAATPAYSSGAFLAGNLYLAGASGLTVFAPDGTLKHTFRTGLELPVSPITTVLTARIRGASEPQLLLATAGDGLLTLDPSGSTFRQLLPAEPEFRDLTTLLELSTGDLLLGTRHRGVLLYNGATLKPLTFSSPGIDPSKLQITTLTSVDSASYLIGTRNAGIFYSHAGTISHADTTSGLPDNQIESAIVSAQHVYIGTQTGTADFDLSEPDFRPTRTIAEGLFAHSLAVEDSTLLVGTLDQGIQPIPLDTRAHFRHTSISVPTPTGATQRIDAFLTAPNSLFALADGTLLRRDSASWNPALESHPTSTGLTDRNVSALAFTPDGTLFIGYFDRGLDQLSPSGALRHLEDDHLFCVNRLALDPTRQTIAAATANGLVLFDALGTPRQTLTRRDGLISDHVTDIAFTPTGTAVATPAGITFIDPTGTQSLYAFEGLVNNHVYALASRLNSAELLAGTLGGLSILQSEAVQRSLTVTNSGLHHNWITAILPTPNDTWLVGTYGAGLQVLDRNGHFSPVELPSATPRDLVINPNAVYATSTHIYAGTLAHGLLVYTNSTGRWSQVTAGLPSLNVTAFAARDGILYLGTENGLVRIPEASIP
jgi:ligand-binding sensor domain-containing protein